MKVSKVNFPIIGAVCGDILGSGYEHFPEKNLNLQLCRPFDIFTDDTVCTIAVADALWNHKDIGKTLKSWCRRYPRAGYGGRFLAWFMGHYEMRNDSWGNGSAMRSSAAGAFAQSIEEALELSKMSAEPTHSHPEGIMGAQATALAIFLAKTGFSKKEIKKEISSRFGYNLDRSYDDIQPSYTFDVSCQGSVPESIICFLESNDYEDAVRRAIAMGGDADTMACISGSIAASFYNEIPERILNHCESRLSREMREKLSTFQ